MYKSTELKVDINNAVNVRLQGLLRQYSFGHYDKVVDDLVLLLNELVREATEQHNSYDNNDDISLCAVCIIDSKYRLGAYQECLELIQLYKANKYYSDNMVLPELLRGWCYLVHSWHGRAEEVARKHLKSSAFNNNPEVDASFLFLLGKARYLLRKYSDARQYYSDSLALFRYVGNVNHSCVVLCALGLLEKDVGRLSKSIEYYDKAYDLVDRSIYRDRAADIRLNKAIALLKYGNSAASLSLIRDNLLEGGLSPLLIAKSMIVNARILLSEKKYDDAKLITHEALSLLSAGSYLREEAVCLETCGDIELFSGNTVNAELYYKRSEQIFSAIDSSSDLVGGVLMRIAMLYNMNNDFCLGLKYSKQSLALLGNVGANYELGVVNRVISESYLGMHNYPASFKYIIKSISILYANESMRELALSHLTAASICIEWHKYYQNSASIDETLAVLVIESYNMIAFDNRTLYEAAWNHALEAHSLFSMYGNLSDVEEVTLLFSAIKSLRKIDEPYLLNANYGMLNNEGTTLVAYSKSMKSLLSIIDIAANTDEPVLITGETGTGKELVAKLIHENGSRRISPFVPVNCAAIPEQLFEREFFGNVKGAYTGAETSVLGFSEQANGGTLFLDEIGDMPLILQVKLLRLLQDGSYHRLGDPTLRKTNIRIIAATNADINTMVSDNRFRSDCYYRLKTLEIYVPPLRERPEDIEPLASLFISKVLGEQYTTKDIFNVNICQVFYKYPWPGNVRELESIVRRLALYAKNNKSITLEMLPKCMQIYAGGQMLSGRSLLLSAYLENAEKERIMQSLISSGGCRTIAAHNLGISRKALYAKMKKMKIIFPI